ncbi:hypothetical protein UFOVP1007_47 [uncultured Caudovirales phage]|uniref:Uncharacterized protein n=1 Tax=uncultured Caudovirales phage TaxID=2100421 RepID=A0A6J5Q7E2_9CAUD|nr:hypothetical protein UFOVP927_16 [uncultured Caudovirales phage]CAB4178276.1 hypothetical protein UFOVP1007_47 [uncultured Caudovirales phage]CAB4187585.1 hypothetical protein UFOVP1159_47 [uncultured Caudovirales phage]
MKLTVQNIHALATKGVGFNSSQLFLLCRTTKPKKGWLSSLVGSEISEELYAQIASLKGLRRSKRSFLPPKANRVRRGRFNLKQEVKPKEYRKDWYLA